MDRHPSHPGARRDWTGLAWAVAWGLVAVAARWPTVARIEGALDHDQSVVGLMALDIAAGRRFPIFFDGQRYMGAVEAYVAAAFVRALGHTPVVVALAPLLAFGMFTAGQFAVWNRWRDRATGHLAAGLTIVGSPMLALWGVVPRGGYVEFLAWALPTMYVYREVSRPGRPALTPWAQAAWGFLLAVGYYLNPLSLTVYVTLALDWTLGRHGADLRRERGLGRGWLDGSLAPVLWLLAGGAWLLALAACCHVDPRAAASGSPYIAFGGATRAPWALALGAAGVLALLGATAWWTRGPARLREVIQRHPWAVAGVVGAWSPFVAFAALVKLGVSPATPSLPVWIAAPWKAGPTLRTAANALGTLIGCDPRALETVFVGQGIVPPGTRWPVLAEGLIGLSPLVVAVVLALVAAVAIRNRPYWRRFFRLRGRDVAPPSALAVSFLAVTAGLYLLQGTSPNASSVRYLVPVWVALPGVLACGLRAVPRRYGVVAGAALVIPWAAAQALVRNDIHRPSPARALAAELTHRGVDAVVAPTPVALVVANLSHGAVGAVEYQAIWPRLGDRYRGRFPSGRPLVCVVDRDFPWSIRGEGGWSPAQDFGRHLHGLAARHPGRVRPAWAVGSFEVWEADVPLADVLATEPDEASASGLASSAR